MKSYKELTGRYLKTQKKRTILTIIGIVLSVALISAISTMVLSFREFSIRETIEYNGNWHVLFQEVEGDKVNLLRKNVNIEEAATTCKIGVSPIAKIPDEEREMDAYIPPYTYLVIQGYDRAALDMLPVDIKEGRAPNAPGEIAVEYWILDLLPGSPKLGDNITLDIGVRIGERSKILESNDTGEMEEVFETHIVRSGEVLEGEEVFEAKGTKEYTIVGLIQPRFEWSTNYFPSAIEYIDNKSMAIDRDYNVYSTMKVTEDIKNQSNTIAENIGLKKIESDEDYTYPIDYNNRLLSLSSPSFLFEIDKSCLYILIFVIAIIIIATIAVIYNAFNISIMERINQFGLLRSVGASPRQIKGIVIKEALIMSAIGIPMGLFCGVLAMKIVMAFIKNIQFEDFDFFQNFRVVVAPMALIISSILGLITVYLSALGPAKKAANISPIEAVRNTGNYKTENFKKVKKGRLAKLLFGIEGQIAYKNLSRNKKRFNITVFSMSISIVLFIVFSSFSSYIFEASSSYLKSKAAFWIYPSSISSASNLLVDEQAKNIKEIEGVDRVYKIREETILAIIPEDKINPLYDKITDNMWQDDSEDKTKRKMHNSSLLGLGNENLDSLKPFLIEGKLDSEVLNREKGIILVKHSNVYNNNTKKYAIISPTTLKVGDTIDIETLNFDDEMDKTTNTVKIVGIVEKGVFDFEYNFNYGIDLITTDEIMAEINHDNSHIYYRLAITLKEGADKEPVLEYIKKLSDENKNLEYIDTEREANEIKKLFLIMSIFLYGFVTVITLISSLNIINTISTNLILRTKELAMFKAVGMSQRGVKWMVTLEGLFYGLAAAIYGGVAGAGLSYVLYRLVIDIQEFEWHFPWEYILISSIGATVIALLSGYIPLRRMSKHIIVEDIRAVD